MSKKITNNLSLILKDFDMELLPDNDSHKNRMSIPSSSSNRKYIVAQNNRGVHLGRWECNCMGWITRRKCKHLEAMMPALMQIAGVKPALEGKTRGKKKSG